MLLGRRKPKVLLDTNAVRDFFRPRKLEPPVLDRVRERFTELCDAGVIRAIMTQPVLWELGSIIDDATPGEGGWIMYEKAVRFYIGHTCRLRTLHEYERKELELEIKMPLKDSQVFFQVDPEEILRDALTESWIRERQSKLAAEKEADAAREAEKRVATVAGLQAKDGEDWRTSLAEMFAGDWDKMIAANVDLEMREFARGRGMRVSPFPQARAARTFWVDESVYFTKAKRVFVDNAAKALTSKSSLSDIPDLVDCTHLRDAAYVDVVVSSDRRLCEVGRASRVSIQFLTFEEFGHALLAH